MTNHLKIIRTPRPSLSEFELENKALHEGRDVCVCYGGEKGLGIAKILKQQNPYGYINFIVAPLSLQLGKPALEDGVLDKEIRDSHCVIVLLDKMGFLKSEKAKKEFSIILEHKKDKCIPIFLKENEKRKIIKIVKKEFGVDLSKIQYAVWDQSDIFLEKLYCDIRKRVIF